METLTSKIDRYEDYAQMGRYVYFGVNVPIAEHFFESQDVSLEPIDRPFKPSHCSGLCFEEGMLIFYRFTLRDQGQTIAIGKITKLITDPAAV